MQVTKLDILGALERPNLGEKSVDVGLSLSSIYISDNSFLSHIAWCRACTVQYRDIVTAPRDWWRIMMRIHATSQTYLSHNNKLGTLVEFLNAVHIGERIIDWELNVVEQK